MAASSEIDPFSFDASFLFCIIGERNRLQILHLLLDSPQTVDAIRRKLKIEATLLSKHLKALRMSGLARTTRSGRNVIYQINPKVIRKGKKQSLFLHCCEIKLKDVGDTL